MMKIVEKCRVTNVYDIYILLVALSFRKEEP